MIEIKLTVTAIPKERIFKGAKGSYLDLVCVEMQKADDYGNTHTVYLKQTKEERAAKTAKVYIGKGKLIVFNDSQQSAPAQTYQHPESIKNPGAAFDSVAAEENNDLPF